MIHSQTDARTPHERQGGGHIARTGDPFRSTHPKTNYPAKTKYGRYIRKGDQKLREIHSKIPNNTNHDISNIFGKNVKFRENRENRVHF